MIGKRYVFQSGNIIFDLPQCKYWHSYPTRVSEIVVNFQMQSQHFTITEYNNDKMWTVTRLKVLRDGVYTIIIIVSNDFGTKNVLSMPNHRLTRRLQ